MGEERLNVPTMINTEDEMVSLDDVDFIKKLIDIVNEKDKRLDFKYKIVKVLFICNFIISRLKLFVFVF